MGDRGTAGVTGGSGRETIEVLHVDDDEAFLDLTKRWLETNYDAIEMTSVLDPAAAMALLESEAVTDGGVELDGGDAAPLDGIDTTPGAAADEPPFDCVVSDYDMPGVDGLEFLQEVREQYPDLPFVLFTGKGSEEIASEAISAGVTDYLQKGTGGDRFTVLANRIENAVGQRRAERQAERSAQRVQQVFDRITDAFVAIDRAWSYTYINERAAELLQVEREELIGTPMLDAFPEMQGTTFEDAFERAMREQEPVTAEDYYGPLDTWFEVRAFPDRDGLSVYFRDVTERKERERRFDAIFNNTYQLTGLMEPDGTLVEANETALEFGGIERADVVGEHLAEAAWITEANRDRVYEAVDRAREGEFVRFEMEINGADGPAVIDFSLKPVTDERGEVTLLIPEGRDITDLMERDRQFDAIFHNTFQFIGLLEPDGTLIKANDTALEFGGIESADVIGKKIWNTHWFQTDEETPERMREDVRRAREGEFVRYELEVQGADGTAVIDFSLKPITDEHGEVVLIVPEGRDITELKERERELERKNERLETFASVVSHDLKNPLGVAKGNLELFRMTGGEDEELVAEAESALDRMEQLVEDVLDLAEKGRVVDEPEPVALGEVVTRTVTAVEAGDVDLRVDAADLTVAADRERLVQLLENLLTNAVEHAEDRVRVAVEDGGAAITVADDGPGVAPGKHEEIFQPGYSTGESGHGFGLAIARSIAEAHGWSLEVTDSDLGGARFVIGDLPLTGPGQVSGGSD